jgi:chromate transporter
MTLTLSLSAVDWLALFTHFATLSLLAVGGAITAAPDMHRFLVNDQHWLTESQFTSSIALAQAAPGPNVMFVALMGWNVGLNAGGGLAAGWMGWVYAFAGVFVAMLGIMLPSSTLTYMAARWGHQNRELRAVRAFKQGMAPIVIALLIATGWLLIAGHKQAAKDWPLWLLAFVAMLFVWKTKIHLLWLLGAGALLGALGWV